MYLLGVEQYLTGLWTRWIYRGGNRQAIPWPQGEGWLLVLNRRARFSAWVYFLMFFGGLVGVLVLQRGVQVGNRQFLFLIVAYSGFVLLTLYYLFFAYWYCLVLDEEGLVLKRFLLPTRSVRWQDVAAFQFGAGEETIKIVPRTGKRIGVYSSLDGLSALRRCLHHLCPPDSLEESWAKADPMLYDQVPAWRCTDQDLERGPFDLLEVLAQGSISI